MNKKELISTIAEKAGLNKSESRKLLNVIIGIVIEEMKKMENCFLWDSVHFR